ncbi:MAG: type II secretion system F family protein [Candidatus Gottesmanbacteria bacterium]|nr:type II secretion system F family protein [Candidatus Gottesmanbacteria bacterium]
MNEQQVSLGNSDRLALIGSLATMLSAGIPILEVVNSLLEDSKGGQMKILSVLHEDLMQGKHVYVTFSKFPRVFDKVTVSVIKASEEAGTLDVTLRDLKQTLQRDIEFSDKVRSAMIYPVFIIVIFLAVLLMILIVVVPKISQVFLRLNVVLPLPTRILMFLSDLLVKNTVFVFGGLALLIVGGIYLYRRQQKAVVNIIYSLPIVSKLIQEIDITRFARSLHLLLSSGLPITAALELTSDVVNRKKTADIIRRSRDMVFAGKKLSEGFRLSKGYIPALMIKLMEAGEKTGTLDKSMQDISEYYDYEVTNTLKTLTALLEPILLVVVGIFVGGMMLAIISPIYGLISQVGRH